MNFSFRFRFPESLLFFSFVRGGGGGDICPGEGGREHAFERMERGGGVMLANAPPHPKKKWIKRSWKCKIPQQQPLTFTYHTYSVGRRPTPPPSPAPEEPSSSSTTDTDASSQDPMLQPQHDDRKGGLLARVFHRGEKREKKKDAYIAAAASWGGERDGEVRRERLGRRD